MNSEKLKFYLLPLLSGLLVGTSYIPFFPWALGFAFVPLWFLWKNNLSLKQVFITGWLTQFTLTLIGFNWISHTLYEFGNFNPALSLLGLLIFCALANIYIPMSGLLWAYILKKLDKKDSSSSMASLLLLVSIIAIGENFIPRIFPWNYGYPLLSIASPIYNLAEYIGFEGLSTLVLVFNVFLFKALIHWRHQRRKSYVFIFTAILALTSSSLIGLIIQKNITPPDAITKVLVVQGNIGNTQKIEAEKHLQGEQITNFIINKYLEQTDKSVNQINEGQGFVLWPETAYPVFLEKAYQNPDAQQLFNYIRKKQIYLVTGAYSYHQKENKYSNSLFFIGPDGEFTDSPYEKHHLLAFGERLPFSDVFPQLIKYLPQVGNFLPGRGPEVKQLNNLTLGPQICYEGLFPDFTIALANKGAQILINTTNDSWFGKKQQPYQHLYMTFARAIEVRRPLIRATNTGFSTAILANGHIYKRSPLHREHNQVLSIPYVKNPAPTFYQQFYLFNKTCILLMFAITLGIIARFNVKF